MDMKKKTRSAALRVRVTEDELEQLREAAAAESRTVSQFVWLTLKARLSQREGATP